MKRSGAVVLAALLAAPLAGCMRSDPVNPNLLAPKLLLDVTVAGEPFLYVHSAFGERAYDRIEVLVDNRTLENKGFAYSFEEPLPGSDLFLEVKARSGESRFVFRGHARFDAARDRVHVSYLSDGGEWSDPRSYGLPFERILDRSGGSS